MKIIKILVHSQPLLFSVIIMILASVLTNMPLSNLFLPVCTSQCAEYIAGVIEQGAYGALMIVLVIKLGLSGTAGLNGPKSWKQCLLYWPIVPLMLIAAIPFPTNIDTSKPVTIFFFVMVYISTGLFEESMMRGAVLSTLLQKYGRTSKGIYGMVILSSIMFGLLHLENYVMGRSSLGANLTQVVYAVFFGVFFAACVLRTKSIWLAMLTHGLFDVIACLNEITVGWEPGVASTTLINALVSIAITLPICIYGLFILRKVKPEDLFIKNNPNVTVENNKHKEKINI